MLFIVSEWYLHCYRRDQSVFYPKALCLCRGETSIIILKWFLFLVLSFARFMLLALSQMIQKVTPNSASVANFHPAVVLFSTSIINVLWYTTSQHRHKPQVNFLTSQCSLQFFIAAETLLVYVLILFSVSTFRQSGRVWRKWAGCILWQENGRTIMTLSGNQNSHSGQACDSEMWTFQSSEGG